MGRKERILIYTDGSCFGNPGKGGYAAIVKTKKKQYVVSGCAPFTTNNRMELAAVIESLASVAHGSSVTVLTDSQYVSAAFNDGHLDVWRQNGWRRIKTGEPVKNLDLWTVLTDVVDSRHLNVNFVKVSAHKSNKFNNYADFLARQAAQRQSKHEIKRELNFTTLMN